jgi:thiamine pyrophosphate-dependent acetolactate synthase large subunit-like protein
MCRDEKATRREQPAERGLNYATVFEAMSEQVPDDAVVTLDVGNNTYAFGRYFEADGQSFLMSGYLGSIGYALPAAMGGRGRRRGKRARGGPTARSFRCPRTGALAST